MTHLFAVRYYVLLVGSALFSGSRRAARRLTAFVVTTMFVSTLSAHAGVSTGHLILENTSDGPLTCTLGSKAASTGSSGQQTASVPAHQTVRFSTSTEGTATPTFDWATCNGLKIRALDVSSASTDRHLVFNGKQTRSLNATLYAFIPTTPGEDFSALISHVVDVYQAQNPQVLLNLGMDPNFDIYTFNALQTSLTTDGIDVMEVDTLFMSFLAQAKLINPVSITGEAPLPVALAGSTVGGKLWGIPSWMCTHFIYSFDPALKQQANSFDGLMKFLQGKPNTVPGLIGDYDGKWTIPSLYINAFVQVRGLKSLSMAMAMPPDSAILSTMHTLSATCSSGGQNPCTNGTFHNASPGTTEMNFATGLASDDEGFSEQSFFIRLKEPKKPLYIVPLPWAQSPPLLYNDAFVTSSANCAPQTPCAEDARAFTTMMTSTSMKNYIVMASDLKPGSPWRTLLVSNAHFWEQPAIQNDPLYVQFRGVLHNAQPFPNNFTPAIQTSMDNDLCTALKKQEPNYSCKVTLQTSYQP